MLGRVDCVVIGGGVIGLAIARQVALRGKEVIVLEQNQRVGMETSSRNSEVVHRGIYYGNSSLKAKLCIEGRKLLFDYLEARNIPFQNCGKLIVASNSSEEVKLRQIYENAVRNGVDDLEFLSQKQVKKLEPELLCHSALHSLNTAIFDSHTFMLNLVGDIKEYGGSIATNCAFQSAIQQSSGSSDREEGFLVETSQGALSTRTLINAAGLHAPFIAQKIAPYSAQLGLSSAFFCKGSYFKLRGKSPFLRLVYPLPSEAGLGVHYTIDLSGAARFGPDTEWLPSSSASSSYVHSAAPPSAIYEVDPKKASIFAAEIRRYWPDVKDDDLVPDYSGIRPKLAGPESKSRDFSIEGHSSHRVKGFVNLMGLESPGLTSSLAVAQYVLKEHLPIL